MKLTAFPKKINIIILKMSLGLNFLKKIKVFLFINISFFFYKKVSKQINQFIHKKLNTLYITIIIKICH